MVSKVTYTDITNKQTNGESGAALVNDTKRAINEVIDIVGDIDLGGVGGSTLPVLQPRQLGDGVKTTFNTPATGSQGAKAQHFDVYLNYVYQRPELDFSIDGATGDLTFLDNASPYAPNLNDTIDIKYVKPYTFDTSSDTPVEGTGTGVTKSIGDWFGEAGPAKVTATGTTTPRSLAEWTSKETLTYNTIAEAKADDKLAVGQSFKTLGYYSVGDGGGNDYVVVAGGTGTDDGGSFIDLNSSGLQAKGLFDSVRNVRQFGAKGDGVTDDTNAFKNSGDLGVGVYGEIFVPFSDTSYLLESDVNIPKIKWVLDFGASLSGVGKLKGAVVCRRAKDGIDIEANGSIDDYSPWKNSLGYALKVSGDQANGSGLPLVSTVRNSTPANTFAFPTAITGYARVDEDGNQAFGIFGRVDVYGATGSSKNELNIFNESGVDATITTNPNQSFGTNEQVPICLAINAGGDTVNARDSAIGLYVGSEGGSTTGFKGGILVNENGCKNYGIAVRGSNTRHLRLIDISGDSEQGPTIYLERESGSPAGGDLLGAVSFMGRNNAGEEVEFAKIRAEMYDSQQSSENGSLRMEFQGQGVPETGMLIDGGTPNNPINLRMEGALKQVTQGAVDSGGAGFRVLRVPN